MEGSSVFHGVLILVLEEVGQKYLLPIMENLVTCYSSIFKVQCVC